MFYRNRKSLVFKVLVVVFYWFIGKYVCVGYSDLKIKLKIALS